MSIDAVEVPESLRPVHVTSRRGIRRCVDSDTGEVSFIPRSYTGKLQPMLFVIQDQKVKGHGPGLYHRTWAVYARKFLAYEEYLGRVQNVAWDAEPAVILTAYLQYLESRSTVTKGKRSYSHEVRQDCTVGGSPSAATLHLEYGAISSIYTHAIRIGAYAHHHPLRRTLSPEEEQQWAKQRAAAGWNGNWKVRDPSRYVRFIDGEWRPQHLFSDDSFFERIWQAFQVYAPSLRERSILLLMAHGGCRVSEACTATLQGWATADPPFGRSVNVRNKGAGTGPVKSVGISSELYGLLLEYFWSDRLKHSGHAQRYQAWVAAQGLTEESNPGQFYQFLQALPPSERIPGDDALFLTQSGGAMTTGAFRVYWRRAMSGAQLIARPHQLRHWHVTRTLQLIERMHVPGTAAYWTARKEFAERMGWKDPEAMLKVYTQCLLDVHGPAYHAELIASADRNFVSEITDQQAMVMASRTVAALAADADGEVITRTLLPAVVQA